MLATDDNDAATKNEKNNKKVKDKIIIIGNKSMKKKNWETEM